MDLNVKRGQGSKKAASQHRRPHNNRAGTACLQQPQPHHGASQFKLLQVPFCLLFCFAAAAVALHTGVWGGGKGGAAIVWFKTACREGARQCNTCSTTG